MRGSREGQQNSGFNVKSVTDIWNVNKIPHPIFRVELEPAEEKLKGNQTHPIYELKYFFHCRITNEQPHVRKGPIHCQEYGHFKSYCKLDMVCVVVNQ